MSPQDLLPRRHDADRHERAIERRVGFMNRDERNAARLETDGFARERGFVRYGEHDGVRIAWEISRTAFSCCMHAHRGQKARAQVLSDDHIVREMMGLAVSRLNVAASRSWS